jgi:hypothetical protein
MKKHLRITLVIIILIAALISCKKNSTPPPKDYAASVKDKTWSGELAYTGKTTEYYAVHFNADNTLLWSQFAGDYTGHWVLTGKELTITFDGNSVEIKATISDDDNLVNITDNTSASEINSGGLIANSTVPLDNTEWKGAISYPVTKALQFSFKPGLQVIINLQNTPVKTYTYTRSPSNAIIRISTIFFGVITSGGKMKGSIDNSPVIWQTVKQ